jgi:UDP:flavonoid glycosyltransferase YjiC (YdhE family)
MATVVIAAFGSWGDVFPAFGVATALRDRGHAVRVAATANYAEFCEDERIDFVPIGPPSSPNDERDSRVADWRLFGLIGTRYLLRNYVFPYLDTDAAKLREVVADADAVVAHPLLFAASIAAEARGVPFATYSLFPELIPSAYSQPVRTPLPSRGVVGRMYNRIGWAIVRRILGALATKQINAARARAGLRPQRHPFFSPLDSGDPYLLLASRCVFERQPDWPSNVETTGYVTWDRARSTPPPPGLDDFLGAGPPPILVTLGASSALNPGNFFLEAAAAIEQLGERALLLTGPAQADSLPTNSATRFVTAFAPLSSVAKRCAVAVHHGGAGTAAAFLDAGTPQLIVPLIYGQPHTAARLRALGVAEVVPWRRATTRRLTVSLRRLLNDNKFASTATAIAAQLAGEDGADRAAERIESLLAN